MYYYYAAWRDEGIFAQLNVNDESCTAHFAQWAGVEAVRGDQAGARAICAQLRLRRDALFDAVADTPGLRAAKPESAFYLYVNVADAMDKLGFTDVNDFAAAALSSSAFGIINWRT